MKDIEKELKELDKRIDDIREQYDKSRKINNIIGCVFIVSALVFTIISLVTGKVEVIYGVLMQLGAGLLLVDIE